VQGVDVIDAIATSREKTRDGIRELAYSGKITEEDYAQALEKIAGDLATGTFPEIDRGNKSFVLLKPGAQNGDGTVKPYEVYVVPVHRENSEGRLHKLEDGTAGVGNKNDIYEFVFRATEDIEEDYNMALTALLGEQTGETVEGTLDASRAEAAEARGKTLSSTQEKRSNSYFDRKKERRDAREAAEQARKDAKAAARADLVPGAKPWSGIVKRFFSGNKAEDL